MKNILICFAFVILFVVNAYSDEINFEKGSFKEVLQKAKEENKIVMIDFYTDWCGWCKRLDEDVYKDKEVAAFANEKQINWKIDAEKGEGPDVAKKYDVSAYPTILFVDGEGKEVDRITGYLPPIDFLQTMKDYNAGINTMSAIKAGLEKNPDDPEANYLMGKKIEKNGDEKEAEKYYNKVLVADPDNKAGFKEKAALGLAMMKQTMDAIKQYIYDYPESSVLKDALIELMYYFSDEGAIDSIKKYYDVAVSKYGNDVQDLNKAYGNSLLYSTYNISENSNLKTDDYKSALELTEISLKFLSGDINEASVHYVRSKLFFRLKDKENANKEIDIAISQIKEESAKKPYLDFKKEINK